VRLIAVGKLKAGPEADIVARYAARLRPGLTIVEVPEGFGAVTEIKRREAVSLLAALPNNAFTVALDIGGAAPTSEDFARQLQAWQGSGRTLCFLIGGVEGLAAEVLARADAVLSFGKLTWPHMLVRVMLVEQMFRAHSILAGHPYHRAGRP
jgi:23S rRNA (pseudouridine1915-N3)-methyltransferase